MALVPGWVPLAENKWYREAKKQCGTFVVIDLIKNDKSAKYRYRLDVYEIEPDYTEIADMDKICNQFAIADWEELIEEDKLLCISSYGLGKVKSYKGNNYRQLIKKIDVNSF